MDFVKRFLELSGCVEKTGAKTRPTRSNENDAVRPSSRTPVTPSLPARRDDGEALPLRPVATTRPGWTVLCSHLSRASRRVCGAD